MPPNLLGATPGPDGTTFRVWAPSRRAVHVAIEGHDDIALAEEDDGYFAAHVQGIRAGARYRFIVDGGAPLPDLASRWQPEGSDGPSVVVDPAYGWTDADWAGPSRFDQVLYELHIGTFSPAGTWQGATERLSHLRALGVTIIHVMPIGTFKGRFGWGYDTTLPYAPFATYGTPDAMRAFVDAAHAHGIGVILDVVYNHVGIGDHFADYSPHYFTTRYENEWGASFNFDGDRSRPVRDFITGNAAYWIGDFHLDGLRLDATQALFDDSDEHIIAELTRVAREAAGSRSIYIIGENHPQDRRLIEPPDRGGYGLDALVSDDFQHAGRVAVTGHNDFYYRDYLGKPQELLSALKYGFLYQGQRSDMREKPYGTYNLDTPPERFVHFLENHDQVANAARGFRLSTLATPSRLRAITALLLLGPQTPCLFQGQEWASSNPFLYFLGLDGEEAENVAKGRRKSLGNFLSVTDPAMQQALPDPAAGATFAASKLDWSEASKKSSMLALHRDLLALRRSEPALSQRTERSIDGAIIGDAALLLRYTTPDPANHLLLLTNLGRDLPIGTVAEPLLAPPPDNRKWVSIWSSEHPDYDGAGRHPSDTDQFWLLPADTTLLMRSEPRP